MESSLKTSCKIFIPSPLSQEQEVQISSRQNNELYQFKTTTNSFSANEVPIIRNMKLSYQPANAAAQFTSTYCTSRPPKKIIPLWTLLLASYR